MSLIENGAEKYEVNDGSENVSVLVVLVESDNRSAMDVDVAALDNVVCDAEEPVDISLHNADKQTIVDSVVHRDLSVDDAASPLVIPKVVVEAVSTHYQNFSHLPSVVRRPQMHSILLSAEQQRELVDFVGDEGPNSTTTLNSAVQYVENNFGVKASQSLVRAVLEHGNIVLPEPTQVHPDKDAEEEEEEDDDEEEATATEVVKVEHTNITVPVAEMSPIDVQCPVEEDVQGERLMVPLRRSSRTRSTLNREQQSELTRVAKQCNAAAVRKLKSYANKKFHVDLPDTVLDSLLIRQSKGYAGGRKTRFRNLHTDKRGSATKSCAASPLEPAAMINGDQRASDGQSDSHASSNDDDGPNCSAGLSKDSSLNLLSASGTACNDSPYSGSGADPVKKHFTFSNVVRRTVVQLVCVNNISHAQVGKLLGIPKGTVSTIVRVFKNSDRIDKIKKGGSYPKLTGGQQLAVAKYVEDTPGVTLDRIRDFVQETFGVSVTRTTVQKLLKKHNLALRKTHMSFVKYLNNEFYEEPQMETTTKTQTHSTSEATVKDVDHAIGSTDDEPQNGNCSRRKKKYTSMSNYIRHKIVEFVVRWGMSHAKVGDLLGVPKGTVSGVVRCFQQNNRINKIKHGGAHCKLTKDHQDTLVKYVADNDDLTIKQAIDYVKQLSGKQVSKNLVYNILRKHNLHKRKKGPVWPEWYLANKEHVVDLPPTKLLLVNSARSKRNPPPPSPPTGKLRIVTDDEGSEHEMLTSGMYSQSSGDVPDVGTDHRLTGTSLGVCDDHDKLPYNYLDDQDSIMLQHVQGLFATSAVVTPSSPTTQVDGKKSTAADNLTLDMPSTTANQVEVSTTPEDEFRGAAATSTTGNAFEESTVVKLADKDAAQAPSKKQKKRYVSLSNVDRQRVISCVVHKGLSHAVVSRLFDIPRGTVSSIMRCFQKNSRIEKIRKGGSPSKLTSDQQRLMVEYNEQHGKLSIKQLQSYCRDTFDVTVSKSTISLILKKHSSPLKKKTLKN